MLDVIYAYRKSRVLRRPTLPCLATNHTVNLTAGCSHACAYCYARSFRSDPGKGRIRFYANSVDLIFHELQSKRTKIRTVYFSTITDPFIPCKEILDAQFQVMELLLTYGAFLIISTKGHVPDSFVDLFAGYPEKVIVHVGINTVNERVRRAVEPDTADVASRLDNCRRLVDARTCAMARVDPIIPGLTDDEKALKELARAVSERNVKHIIMSYLFLRRSNRWPGSKCLGSWSYECMKRQHYTCPIDGFCSGGTALLPPLEYRRQKYTVLRSFAEQRGMSATICGCKNPDVATTCCMERPTA